MISTTTTTTTTTVAAIYSNIEHKFSADDLLLVIVFFVMTIREVTKLLQFIVVVPIINSTIYIIKVSVPFVC